MRKAVILVSLTALLLACKKEQQVPAESFSEAEYGATVTGKWNATDFGLPAGAHFTLLAGAVHNKNVSLWMENALASRSLQYVAENGFSAPLLKDVDTLIQLKKALVSIAVAAPLPAGKTTFTFSASTDYPVLSFASMLAPSPDWFTGVNNLPLYRNASWTKDTTVQLYAYDAGTKDGDVFSYYQPPTSPQQTIQRLTLSTASVLFKGTTLPVAELRLQKME